MKKYSEYMAEVREAIEKINAWMDHYDLTVADLGREAPAKRAPRAAPAAKKSRKHKVRYRGPGGEKWSGQGSQPRWITDSGKPKEAFRV